MQMWGDTGWGENPSYKMIAWRACSAGTHYLESRSVVREFLSHGPSRIFRVLMLLGADFKKPSTLPSLTLFSAKWYKWLLNLSFYSNSSRGPDWPFPNDQSLRAQSRGGNHIKVKVGQFLRCFGHTSEGGKWENIHLYVITALFWKKENALTSKYASRFELRHKKILV